MLEFLHDALPGRVVFGAGSLERLPDEVARLGAARALVVSTPGHRQFAEDAAERLAARAAGIWDGAKMHAPLENVEAARAEARRLAADACVAIGGGTPIGLAKAIALELELPIVAVPTTYAGSEMTPVLGITEGGVKRTRRDPKMLPKTVIYDPELTFTLPAAVSGPSGMNAIAHCVEALYARDGNPLTSLIAEEGIRALAASLPVVVREPEHAEARAEALYGAWLAGTALAAVGMALHHKLCHVLGGTFDLPHAEVHTIILPHATAYNRAGAPAAMARIAQRTRRRGRGGGPVRPRRRARRQAEPGRDRPARIRPRARRRPRRREPLPQPDPAHPRRHPRPARRRVPRATAGVVIVGAADERDRSDRAQSPARARQTSSLPGGSGARAGRHPHARGPYQPTRKSAGAASPPLNLAPTPRSAGPQQMTIRGTWGLARRCRWPETRRACL